MNWKKTCASSKWNSYNHETLAWVILLPNWSENRKWKKSWKHESQSFPDFLLLCQSTYLWALLRHRQIFRCSCYIIKFKAKLKIWKEKSKRNSEKQINQQIKEFRFVKHFLHVTKSQYFFPIWILIVLIYWTSRNNFKKHSVTTNCSDLSLFE